MLTLSAGTKERFLAMEKCFIMYYWDIDAESNQM